MVDGVTTVPAGGAATAGASFDGADVRFTFGLPRGDVGETGAPGPQGIQGEVGPVGPPFTSFVVDGVTTLDPAQPATVTAVFDGTNVRLAFGIPRGQQGNEGPQGITGATGATGPAFTSFVVESVSTLPPGNQATVTTFFDGTSVRFSFGIPQGQQGNQGNNGFDGAPGAPGPQGPPGEVTAAQLASAIAGAANNTNGVAALGLAVSDPPTQGQMQAIADKLDELISALRRL